MREIGKSNLDEAVWNIANRITPMGYWDKNLVCQYANNAYVEWFGISPQKMIGKMRVHELLGPELYKLNLPLIRKALNGEKQVFERRFVLPCGKVKDAIITYLPDVTEDGREVRGFFVHVSDVTLTKLQEAESLAATRAKDKEVLRSVIDIHEKERDAIAVVLRDGVNQTFAYSKLMLQAATFKNQANQELKIIEQSIQLAINELNALSASLSLSAVKLLGLEASIEDLVRNYNTQSQHHVQFVLDNEADDTLSFDDKVSIFRIVQNFLQLMSAETDSRKILITLDCLHSHTSLVLAHDDLSFIADELNHHYINIKNRVRYYDGFLSENCEDGQYKMVIDLNLSMIQQTA